MAMPIDIMMAMLAVIGAGAPPRRRAREKPSSAARPFTPRHSGRGFRRAHQISLRPAPRECVRNKWAYRESERVHLRRDSIAAVSVGDAGEASPYR